MCDGLEIGKCFQWKWSEELLELKDKSLCCLIITSTCNSTQLKFSSTRLNSTYPAITHIYTHMHTYIYLFTHTHIHTHAHTYIYIYIYIHTHIDTHAHIYTMTHLVHVPGFCQTSLHLVGIGPDDFQCEIINKVLKEMEHTVSQAIRLTLQVSK